MSLFIFPATSTSSQFRSTSQHHFSLIRKRGLLDLAKLSSAWLDWSVERNVQHMSDISLIQNITIQAVRELCLWKALSDFSHFDFTDCCLLLFSANVLSGSVDEPLEPGGDGEEGSWQLPHPPPTDHQEDQRGQSPEVKSEHIVLLITCEVMAHCSPCVCLCSGSGAVSVRVGGSPRDHVLLHAAPGTTNSVLQWLSKPPSLLTLFTFRSNHLLRTTNVL